MTSEEIENLEKTSFKVREHIIRMSTDGGCFIGASLSCTDILVYLYKCYLNVSEGYLNSQDRDYFLLSKGHDVPALYGTLAEVGILDSNRLKNHLKTNDDIYWHPNGNVPGVEFHSGSLGHLLSVAMGIAYDIKLRKGKNKVVVMLGDGELNEGSVWEGLLVAASKNLDNLVAIIDRNKFQANIETEKLIRLESLENKFKAFGWNVNRTDGHNFEELDKSIMSLDYSNGKPNIIIADTVRGKGLPSIENKADRWFVNFSTDEVENLLIELYTKKKTKLTSKTLMVR
ncbi:MAG: 1-deoxy-D-xylulose-5-phosphate synthase N-terminal domain-containing protein [Candidatus Kapaibacterium sp.]